MCVHIPHPHLIQKYTVHSSAFVRLHTLCTCTYSLTGYGLLHHYRERCEDIFDGAAFARQVKLVYPLLLHQVVLVSGHGNGSQVAVRTTNK